MALAQYILGSKITLFSDKLIGLIRRLVSYSVLFSLVVNVGGSAKLAQDCEVLGSIPAPFKLFSRGPAILKFAGCQHTKKIMEK